MGGPPSRASVRGSGAAGTCRRSRSVGRLARSVSRPSAASRPAASSAGGSIPSRAAIRAAGGGVSPVEASRSRLPVAKTAAGGPSATTSPARMHDDPPEMRGRELHVVGDRDDRSRPAARKASTIAPTRATPSAVLPGRRLVEDEDRGIHRQDPGERHQLAARQVEVVRVGRPRIRSQADRGQARLDEAGRRPPPEAQVARPERDLASDRPLEQLVVGVLEHEPDGPGELGDRS